MEIPGIILGGIVEAERIGHWILLNSELGIIGEVTENRFQTVAMGQIYVLIHIEVKSPVGSVSVPMEAVIDHQELVVVIAVELRLSPDVLHRHPPGPHPRIQYCPCLIRHPTRVVEHEMRLLSEEPRVICHPFPQPRRAQVPVQRRPAIQILVLVRRAVLGLVVSPRSFLQCRELLHLSGIFAVVGVDAELAARIVVVGIDGEGAIDDDDGVDAAVAPIGEHLVGQGAGGGAVGGDPLALEPGAAVDVDGLGGEANHCECGGAAAVGPHLDEERGGVAV